jgi:hypothetical protein
VLICPVAAEIGQSLCFPRSGKASEPAKDGLNPKEKQRNEESGHNEKKRWNDAIPLKTHRPYVGYDVGHFVVVFSPSDSSEMPRMP